LVTYSIDLEVEHTISADTHHMKVDYSVYEGWEVQGKCRTTILRGTVAVDDGIACIDEGFGQYIPRKPFNPRY